jgi:RNA polymerase sigma-70 factor (ECF subfamily)
MTVQSAEAEPRGDSQVEDRDLAYAALVAPVSEKMKRAIARIVRDPDEADDALQEAAMQIWRNLGKIKRHPNPDGYILRVCISAAYDALRKRSRRKRREKLVGDVDLHASLDVAGLEPVQRERINRIMNVLGELPRKQAMTFYLREIEGLTFEEVAESLGSTARSARANLSIAKTKLREILKAEEQE